MDLNNLFGFFLFIAASSKSAQFGLHAWLPDAMEGPTPVSVLLHSATMMTASVFIVLRFYFLFTSIVISTLVFLIVSCTAFFGSYFAFYQSDLKKIIAFSTCSQLGFMFAAIGLQNPTVAFYHLSNHAFFKSLLFLTAGSIIHNLFNEQDIRKIGGLINYLPLTFVCMLSGSLGLVGFPFFSGFYSKEIIILSIFQFHNFKNYYFLSDLIKLIYFVSGFLLFLSCVFTVLYSLRILYKVFFCNFVLLGKFNLNFITETPMISLVLIILSLFTMLFGFLFEDFFVGAGSDLNVVWSFFLNFETFRFLEKDFVNSFCKFIFVYVFVHTYTNIFCNNLLFKFIKSDSFDFKFKVLHLLKCSSPFRFRKVKYVDIFLFYKLKRICVRIDLYNLFRNFLNFSSGFFGLNSIVYQLPVFLYSISYSFFILVDRGLIYLFFVRSVYILFEKINLISKLFNMSSLFFLLVSFIIGFFCFFCLLIILYYLDFFFIFILFFILYCLHANDFTNFINEI